jgi:hypothetical protein
MSRHLHRSTLELFERVLGPTHTTLARKKARLVLCTPDDGAQPARSPGRSSTPARRHDGGDHAGVHAAGRLDPGTRLFLSHLPADPDRRAHHRPRMRRRRRRRHRCRAAPAGVEVTCIDESHLAVASAEATYELSASGDRRAVPRGRRRSTTFRPERRSSAGSVDLVLVNPPFHADHAIGDDTAWRMFVVPAGSCVPAARSGWSATGTYRTTPSCPGCSAATRSSEATRGSWSCGRCAAEIADHARVTPAVGSSGRTGESPTAWQQLRTRMEQHRPTGCTIWTPHGRGRPGSGDPGTWPTWTLERGPTARRAGPCAPGSSRSTTPSRS